MSSQVSEKAKDLRQKADRLGVNLTGIVLYGLVLGLVTYLVAVFIAYLQPESFPRLLAAMNDKEAYTIGLPCAAVGAFGVVALLLRAFPPEKPGGVIKFTLFGLVFTGPAGPITFWLACFLSFVAAMKWLR